MNKRKTLYWTIFGITIFFFTASVTFSAIAIIKEIPPFTIVSAALCSMGTALNIINCFVVDPKRKAKKREETDENK